MSKRNLKLDVVCLYEASGYSARAWVEAGYTVYCYDISHPTEGRVERVGKGFMHFVRWDAKSDTALDVIVSKHKGRCHILLGFPPCTDLAVSGAAWFAAKAIKNPAYRDEAMAMVYLVRDAGEALNVPYVIENPVSVISSVWRKPDHIFHPYEYGGYLPEDDVHPDWPDYIMPRDAYPKKTCYWVGNGFVMPDKKPVPVLDGYSVQHRKLGGKSAKTKSIRSASPRGVCRAIYFANHDNVNFEKAE